MKTANRLYRKPAGKGFFYQDEAGQRVADQQVIDFAKGLAIPPAWRDVEITLNERAKIRATGYDAAGRKQYIYNADYRQRQDKAKFDRLLAFAEALPHMRRVTGQHLRRRKLDRNKVLACMVRLIDQAYFRVGNDVYARENQTYGLTTMRSRHLRVEGDRLIFEYVGKSHKLNHREVEDKALAKIVAEVDSLPGYEIFKYYDEDRGLVDVKSDDLNEYIKEVMGQDFSAKDFRTWSGTLIAAVALAELGAEGGHKPVKKHVTEAVKRVAERLGNTPAIARASYIDPRVIDHYLNGTTLRIYLREIKEALADPGQLSPEETALLRLLRRRLRRRQLSDQA